MTPLKQSISLYLLKEHLAMTSVWTSTRKIGVMINALRTPPAIGGNVSNIAGQPAESVTQHQVDVFSDDKTRKGIN